MPFNIRVFMIIYGLSVIIGAIHVLTFQGELLSMAPQGPISPELATDVMYIGLGIGCVINFGLIWFAGFGRANWARVVLLAMTTLSVLASVLEFSTGSYLPQEKTVELTCAVLEIVAMILVFSGGANQWFKTAANQPR